ncbi:M4 family metallopeptidase [Virgibacillus sp. DJP39]|uniref:M4 family metallopeptidase n=1 Tax=Virgibacillus sp. DJP39 TaxID=3409790 RepID=UPI003BB7ED83
MNWKPLVTSLILGTGIISGGTIAYADTDSKLDQKTTTPQFMTKKFHESKVDSKKAAISFLKENADDLGINPNKDLIFIKVMQDDLGMSHYTFQPAVEGIPVANARVIVHTDQNGEVTSVNGNFHNDAPAHLKQQRKINKKDAIGSAWNHIEVNREEADKKVKSLKGGTFHTLTENSDLVVYHNEGTYSLAYHIELQFAEPYPANWQVYVNAESGEILQAINLVNEATGRGTGVLGDTKYLNTYFTNSNYYLFDITKPMNGVIETFDNYGGQSLPGYYVTDSGNTFYSERQKAAVDAHYYAGQVFDYYYDTFGRVSYDNQGSSIRSTVHYGNNYNNAAWTGNQMIYGDGDGSTFTYLSGANDVVAHELTHAVTDTTAGLVYQSQSGALNESFSDVFGFFVDSEDWLMGEDVYTPYRSGDALRSMSNPNAYNQPDHMNEYQDLPVTKEGDWGGVHTNSGIPNKAAYYTINNLGISVAENVYYRALTVYLTPDSDFSYARAALEQSATDLYGSSTANAVSQAWNNVGVY